MNGEVILRTKNARYQSVIGQATTASFYDVMAVLKMYGCTSKYTPYEGLKSDLSEVGGI